MKEGFFKSADNESKNGNLYIIKVSSSIRTELQRFLQVMKRFLFLKNPHYLHLKWRI